MTEANRLSKLQAQPHVRQPDARILVIDDEEINVRLLKRLLLWAGYRNITTVVDSSAALEQFEAVAPDLVMLDLNMPQPDGFAIMRGLEERIPAESYLPVIVLSGELSPEAKQRAFSSVAKDFVGKPFDAMEILLRIGNLLQTRYLHLALHEQNWRLEEMVRERTQALVRAQTETLRRLAQAAEFRDDETGQHTRRVGAMAALIAREMQLPDELIELIEQAAPLHDVGKIGIPDSVLLKPGRLTSEEFTLMKRHTVIGGNLLAGGRSEVARMAEQIARCHHERWDGSGYPAGLAGEEIPLPARVVALADFYDALSSARPYRPAWAKPDIFEEISKESGKHFDPEIVQAFFGLVESGATVRFDNEWSGG